MRRLTPLSTPGLKGEVVRVSELSDAGVKEWRKYASDLGVPLHGTRARPGMDATSFSARVQATQLLLREGQFVSRHSAAALLRIPVQAQSKRIDVGAIRPDKPLRRPQIAGHQVQAGVLRLVPTAPNWLPTPEDVWALLGAVCSLDELIVAGDHLISDTRRSRSPGCTMAALESATKRFQRCQGVGKLREALALVRHGVASPPETQLRLLIVRAGFDEPQTNCPVPTTGRTLHADLGYPQWRIAIEYDGIYHFENGPEQLRFDTRRYERMRAAGWVVLQLTSLDLKSPGEFLTRLAKAIAEAQ